MKTVYVNNITGISNDSRSTVKGKCRMISNFDVLSTAHTISPYRDSVSGNTNQSVYRIRNYCIALGGSSTWYLWGLGVKSGASTVKVYRKSFTTGGSGDLSDGVWDDVINSESASGGVAYNLFVYYHTTGLIYGLKGGTGIWSFDPTLGTAFNDSEHSLSYTNSAQGLVHSKDDILYVPYDNKIASNNAGTWNMTALTLPDQLYVTSICEQGNYLAIACAPLSGLGKSYVYLWDRDSSLATLSESIDWGEGVLKVIENIDGTLIGVSLSGNSTTRFQNRIEIKYYDGQGAVQFPDLSPLLDEATGTQVTGLGIFKQKISQRMFFLMSIYRNGSVRNGVWSIGKQNGVWALTHERTPDNDTATSGNNIPYNFFYVGDYLFQSYTDINSDDAMSKTNSTASYTATAILETVINPAMVGEDVSFQKKWFGMGASYAPLASGQQVVMSYRIDGGNWVTVFTETTTGKVVSEVSDAAGTPFTDGREIEFKFQSTGGAAITGYWYKYDSIKTIING